MIGDHECCVLSGGFQDCGKTVKDAKEGVSVLDHMCSKHEEADHRILFHKIIIWANDTDIICLAL